MPGIGAGCHYQTRGRSECLKVCRTCVHACICFCQPRHPCGFMCLCRVAAWFAPTMAPANAMHESRVASLVFSVARTEQAQNDKKTGLEDMVYSAACHLMAFTGILCCNEHSLLQERGMLFSQPLDKNKERILVPSLMPWAPVLCRRRLPHCSRQLRCTPLRTATYRTGQSMRDPFQIFHRYAQTRCAVHPPGPHHHRHTEAPKVLVTRDVGVH